VALARLRLSVFSVVVLFGSVSSVFAQRADLAKARTFYNQRQFDAAIEAAAIAQKIPSTADAVPLKRERTPGRPALLIGRTLASEAARERLRRLDPLRFSPTERAEFIVGLGEALFFDDDYGAAATLFESGIEAAVREGPQTAESMLEWWGSAMERHADALEKEPRVAAFGRLRDRMAREQSKNPGSAAAAYWFVVGTRGAGEPIEAWEAAIAGWVRARLAGPYSAKLRADLDKLVLEGIIPDRVRASAPDRRTQIESDLKAEWAVVKERWK